jgi:hypothetical protein
MADLAITYLTAPPNLSYLENLGTDSLQNAIPLLLLNNGHCIVAHFAVVA